VAAVLLTEDARKQVEALPLPIRARVQGIFERLANWPRVSGAKALRGDLAGQFRIRTGDYRVQFAPHGEVVTVTKAGHRDGFYDE